MAVSDYEQTPLVSKISVIGTGGLIVCERRPQTTLALMKVPFCDCVLQVVRANAESKGQLLKHLKVGGLAFGSGCWETSAPLLFHSRTLLHVYYRLFVSVVIYDIFVGPHWVAF